MAVNERLENWKNTVVDENIQIDIALFRAIVKNAISIENRTFGFKISKKTILENLRWANIVAFNGTRGMCYGRNACYMLSMHIGRESTEMESIALYIRLK